MQIYDLITKQNPSAIHALNWEAFLNINSVDWKHLFTDEIVTLELENFEIVKPDGLLMLAYIALYRDKVKQLPTRIVFPKNPDIANFIDYYGVSDLRKYFQFEMLNRFVFERKTVRGISKLEKLNHIEYINGTNWVNLNRQYQFSLPPFVNKVFGSSGEDNIFDEATKPFTNILIEFLMNIFMHGGVQRSNGAGLISFTPPLKNYPRTRFGFSDIGLGIKESLARKNDITKKTSSKEAVVEALIYRLRKPADGIVGIFNVIGYIQKFNGKIQIRTSDILFTLDFKKIPLDKGPYQIIKESFFREHEYAKEWFMQNSTIENINLFPGTHIIIDLDMQGAKWK